jgi:hypothetical protein
MPGECAARNLRWLSNSSLQLPLPALSQRMLVQQFLRQAIPLSTASCSYGCCNDLGALVLGHAPPPCSQVCCNWPVLQGPAADWSATDCPCQCSPVHLSAETRGRPC